ncbi:MAG: FtsH protease activity modulator HflK [Gammaproteobacteria bacterium]|nr:FtsH protease activity modulator HflK [Gammaproteobacteria bacterium]
MTQDNDPWGNNPRNTENNELGAIVSKIKDSLFGSGGNGGSEDKSPSNGFPSGLSPKAIAPIAAIALLGWFSTGVYILPEGSHGVELTFGKYSETATQAGFNFRMPYPIGSVDKVDIGSLKSLSVGSSGGSTEGQMLTSDENIVEISLSVQYKIGNAESYLFNVNNPELVLKETLISSIREVVGSSTVDYVLTNGRAEWPARVRESLAETLKGFDVGFDIIRVELRNAKAPEEVQDAFDDAVKAREDADRYKLQAEAYQNKQVPLARGKAKEITEQAEGYKASVIAKATGEANRFGEILATYKIAPSVTRDRMYIEALQSVYQNVNNVVVATGKDAPVMYLPMTSNNATQNSGTNIAPLPLPAITAPKRETIQEDEFKITKPESKKRLTR